MIIPHEIIPKDGSTDYWSSYYYTNSDISNEMICLVIIVNLHLQGKINDHKRNSMIRSLRNGTLLRKVNTHHCTINNKWYNDEGIFSVLCDAYRDVCKRQDLTVREFLPYIKLYTSKNWNYSLNFIFYEFISPLLDNLNIDRNVKMLRKFNIKDLETKVLTYEEADRKGGLGRGYCCEDCDGCYTQYKRSRYEYNYDKYNKKEVADLFINYLNSLKVGRWKLNPQQLSYQP